MDSYVSALNDIVFKALFVHNEGVLRGFLRDVLDLPITARDEVKIQNPELIPDEAGGKMSRLDIRVGLAYRKFNIEMQARREDFYSERALYYWAEMYGDKFPSGGKYLDLQQTYSVNVLGFNVYDCPDYHSDFAILERTRQELFCDKLSIHVFELQKVPKELIEGDKAQKWMELIKAETAEELEMVRETTDNPDVLSGVDTLLKINADDQLRERIFDREKALRDYGNDIAVAESRGRDVGRAEGRIEGREEGRAEGRIEGLEEGRSEGRIERDNEIVKNMRKCGFTEAQIQMALGAA